MKRDFDRPLPHSAETERAILGAILLDVAGTDEALQTLRSSDFFLPQHISIFRRLREQRHAGGRPDIVALNDGLAASGELEKIPGGAGYVSALYDGLPRVCPLATWIGIVQQKALLREHARRAQRTLELILNSNGDARKTLAEIEMLCAQIQIDVRAERKLRFQTGAELAAAVAENIGWIFTGYVARGAVTELVAKIKCGKTEWALRGVRAALDGIGFMGQRTQKTSCVYLSEQNLTSFREAMRRADLLGRPDFHVLAYADVRSLPWPEVAAAASAKCRSCGAGLLIIDTLSQFAALGGDAENNSGDALAAMEPLQRAASEGIAVLMLRHERKSGGDLADAGRGSSAFGGAADIVLSLRRPEGRMRKTIRRLEALSRFGETPADVLIELRENSYVSLGAPHEVAVEEAKNTIAAAAPATKTTAISLESLAEKAGVPRSTAQRAVEALLKSGLLEQAGKGKKGDPLRYFIPERFCPNS